MKIRILAIAKKAQSWVSEGEKDFLKRIQPFAQISLELIQPLDENSLGSEKACKQEGEKLLSKIHEDEFLIACDKDGKTFSSPSFAKKIKNLKDSSQKTCFVIGGSNGLSEEVKSRANLQVSFSTLTFPHELFRIMLLEQIYRACMILSGRKYHK